jgi:hypothetical protein
MIKKVARWYFYSVIILIDNNPACFEFHRKITKKHTIFKYSNNINYLIHPLNPPPARDKSHLSKLKDLIENIIQLIQVWNYALSPTGVGLRGWIKIFQVKTKNEKHINFICV